MIVGALALSTDRACGKIGGVDRRLSGTTRAERILGALAAHPGGLCAREIADLTGEPGRVEMIHCLAKLGELERSGWVSLAGKATGRGRFPGRAVHVWKLAADDGLITLVTCAADELGPAGAGILARIALTVRDRDREETPAA